MKANVGGIDKVLRIVVGGVFVGLAVADVVGIWGWLGAVGLVTGFASRCPMYSLIGANTANAKE